MLFFTKICVKGLQWTTDAYSFSFLCSFFVAVCCSLCQMNSRVYTENCLLLLWSEILEIEKTKTPTESSKSRKICKFFTFNQSITINFQFDRFLILQITNINLFSCIFAFEKKIIIIFYSVWFWINESTKELKWKTMAFDLFE